MRKHLGFPFSLFTLHFSLISPGFQGFFGGLGLWRFSSLVGIEVPTERLDPNPDPYGSLERLGVESFRKHTKKWPCTHADLTDIPFISKH